jgi:hypothetical protein
MCAHLEPVDVGHLEVEDDQVRSGVRLPALEGRLTREIRDPVEPFVHDAHVEARVGPARGHPNQDRLILGILYDQQRRGTLAQALSSLWRRPMAL